MTPSAGRSGRPRASRPSPAAAAGLAALLTGAYKAAPGERVAVIISGANMTPSQLDG
jgi:threonine dehydratase